MSDKVHFTCPDLNEALSMAPLMREADVLEVAGLGQTPEQAITQSFYDSDMVWLAYFEGRPAALIGVGRVSVMGNQGTPWFLTSNVMNEWGAKRALLKYSPVFIQDFLDNYDILVNYVDAKYTKALTWLKWLGFTIDDNPEPSPITGAMFYRILKVRP